MIFALSALDLGYDFQHDYVTLPTGELSKTIPIIAFVDDDTDLIRDDITIEVEFCDKDEIIQHSDVYSRYRLLPQNRIMVRGSTSLKGTFRPKANQIAFAILALTNHDVVFYDEGDPILVRKAEQTILLSKFWQGFKKLQGNYLLVDEMPDLP